MRTKIVVLFHARPKRTDYVLAFGHKLSKLRILQKLGGVSELPGKTRLSNSPRCRLHTKRVSCRKSRDEANGDKNNRTNSQSCKISSSFQVSSSCQGKQDRACDTTAVLAQVSRFGVIVHPLESNSTCSGYPASTDRSCRAKRCRGVSL